MADIVYKHLVYFTELHKSVIANHVASFYNRLDRWVFDPYIKSTLVVERNRYFSSSHRVSFYVSTCNKSTEYITHSTKCDTRYTVLIVSRILISCFWSFYGQICKENLLQAILKRIKTNEFFHRRAHCLCRAVFSLIIFCCRAAQTLLIISSL